MTLREATIQEYAKQFADIGEITKCKENEVKPCPFCGGKEIVLDEYEHQAGERFRIFCTACMAMIDPGYAQNKHTVIEMWNKRSK